MGFLSLDRGPKRLDRGLKRLLVSSMLMTEASGLDNGVGLKPAMGWNSWNAYRARLDENVVKNTADLLVSTGLADKGYRYVNLDDTWASGRSVDGVLFPNATKFPSGMHSLASYVHQKKLLFGIYTDAGVKTCAKAPGSWGHEVIDAQTFANWTVDFVKSDSCFTNGNTSYQPADGPNCQYRYGLLAKALNETGRAMVHSVKGPCGRNHSSPCSPVNAAQIANLRRTSMDVNDNWSSIPRIVNDAAAVTNLSRPGFFGDLDILEIGNGGLSAVEEQTMFTMWCVLKSPLLLGNDLGSMSKRTLDVVGNEALIAINQDPLGLAAQRISNEGGQSVWVGPLANGDKVLAMFNAGADDSAITVHLRSLGYPSESKVQGHDLWVDSVAVFEGTVSAHVQAHGAAAFRLKLQSH